MNTVRVVRFGIFGFLTICGALSPATSFSDAGPAGLTADQIMEKNFYATKIHLLRSDSTMVLENNSGQKRVRKMVTLSKLQKNGIDSNLLVKFTSPADINGTTFLQMQHNDGDDDQWIYLPALHKVRRLVANNKADSFVGSDFSYGDLLLPKVGDYRNTLLRSEPVGDADCYVIESEPKSDAIKQNSGYSKKITWVKKDTYVEAKVQYYDPSGELIKTQMISQDKLIEPSAHRWFPLLREMVNHQTGHKTIISFEQVTSSVPIPDSTFTTRYMVDE
jgi:outer membrane lipoprotein-sorting protein